MKTIRAAFWLIREVTIPSLRAYRLRAILTLVGVVIGTQVVVAVGLINRSVLASFDHTVETIAGRADLQLSNGSAGVPEELVATLAAVPGVASAAGLLQGTLTTDWGDLTVFGVDLFEDQTIRETQFPRKHVHIPDGLVFANSPDSIAVSSPFLTRAGLGPGRALKANSPTGQVSLTVRGSLDPAGPAALFGGAVGLVDFPTAQRLFARPGRFDQIDLIFRSDANVADVSRALAPLVAGVGTLEAPQSRGAALGSMLAAVQTVLTLVSLNAVVVGVFIIYHTMHTAIATRRRELALARAVGYRQRALSAALALEALVFGTIGSAFGILLGIGAARLSLGLVTAGIGAIWAHVDYAGLVVSARDILGALALGVASTVAAAAAPTVAAARMRVLDHLRSSEALVDAPHVANVRTLAPGIILTLVAFALLYSGLRPEGFSAKIALIMGSVVLAALGYTMLIPLITALLIEPAAALGRRFTGPTTVLATENIARDPTRMRGTVAALMVAFAMVLIVSAFIHSMRTSILSWVDQTLAADLQVSPTTQLPLPSSPTLSGALETRLRAIPGVAEISPSRMINARIGDTLAVLRTESAGGFERQDYPLVAGDAATLQKRFAQGAVLVSDNFAYRHGVRAGDSLTLDTPSGKETFSVAAVVIDYTLDIGTIVIERETYRRFWHDDLVNSFRLWLAPGADIDGVRQAISAAARPEFSPVILTAAEYKQNIAGALDDALLMTYAIQLVAIAIAVIGVVNFFLAEIVDRRREIGLLRSVALKPRQVLRMIATEAGLIGAIGGIVAILYALPIAHALITRSTRLVSGWGLTFAFPFSLALVTIAVAAATSILAALYPARTTAATRVADLVMVE